MNIMCIFARVVDAARDKNHNSFSARSGEKVAHDCIKSTLMVFWAIRLWT